MSRHRNFPSRNAPHRDDTYQDFSLRFPRDTHLPRNTPPPPRDFRDSHHGVCPSRVYSDFPRAHGVISPRLPPTVRGASQTRSFLASAESPPTGVTTIDYRRVWRGGRAAGEEAMVCCAGVARGWRIVGRVASSRFMALAERQPETTLPSVGFTIPGARGGDENIAFSVAFLSPACLRGDSSFFGGPLPRRCRRPPVNPGCPAATRQRHGELAGRGSVARSRSIGVLMRYYMRESPSRSTRDSVRLPIGSSTQNMLGRATVPNRRPTIPLLNCCLFTNPHSSQLASTLSISNRGQSKRQLCLTDLAMSDEGQNAREKRVYARFSRARMLRGVSWWMRRRWTVGMTRQLVLSHGGRLSRTLARDDYDI